MNTTTVYHIVIHSPDHCKAVQERLFQLGYRWVASPQKEVRFTDARSLQLNFNEGGAISRSERSSRNQSSERWGSAKVVTLDDLYGPEFANPQTVEVQLNASHKAIVHKDKIVVGCQEFDPSILFALSEAHKKVSQ